MTALAVETGSFWTERQRQGNSLHEVPYRACFKPQLPQYFLARYSQPGEIVLDPFMGRGTTLIEAALHGRIPAGNDINPLSAILVRPRLHPPALEEIATRLQSISWHSQEKHDPDLLAYYHPETLTQILALRRYLLESETSGTLDAIDDWIRMVAVTRLTGHSTHFFSVYTLPPNQATYPERQRKINAQRNQQPEPRDVSAIILRKSRQMLKDVGLFEQAALQQCAQHAVITTGPSHQLPGLPDHSVSLVITSPPFLTEVDYRTDNWLRCWFLGVDSKQLPISQIGRVPQWQDFMEATLRECARVLRPGGHAVVEVGEVRKGAIKLEELLLEAGSAAGLTPVRLMINAQKFTKTSNCWGVTNQEKGTNTNRLVIFTR